MNSLERMTQAYFEAIDFTETGDAGQPEAGVALTPLSRAQAYIDCRNFHCALTRQLPTPLPAGIDWARVGHDFWLTRNGHGCGFWDRPEVYGEDLSQWLTAMAVACGGRDIEFEGQE